MERSTSYQYQCHRHPTIIVRSASSRRRPGRHKSPARSYSLRMHPSLRTHPPLPTHLPFSNLMRSSSQENAEFIQSVHKLKETRDRLLANSLKRSYQFSKNDRKSSISGKAQLLASAYPPVKCQLCPRQFAGPHRKRNLVGHRRRVHGCGSRGRRVEWKGRSGREGSQRVQKGNSSLIV